MNDETQEAPEPVAGGTPIDADPPSLEDRFRAIEERLAHGSARMKRIEKSVDDNTKITKANTEMTGQLLELMQAAKAGFRVAGWVGTAVRWLGRLAAAVATILALWHMVKNGGAPPHAGE